MKTDLPTTNFTFRVHCVRACTAALVGICFSCQRSTEVELESVPLVCVCGVCVCVKGPLMCVCGGG